MSELVNPGARDAAPAKQGGGYRRRVFIVDARLQFKIVFHLFLLSCLIGVLGALLASFYFLHLAASHPGRDPGLHTQIVFLGLSIATSAVLIVTVVGIFISHGIAGPVFRFRKIIRAVIEKRPVPVTTLRRHDYLQGMARDLEALLSALKSESEATARTARDGAEGIARAVAALKAGGNADASLLKELGGIQECLAQAAGEVKAP